MLRTVLTIIQVFSSLAIVALVLIQRGKGSEAGAGFGAGASGSVFGARGARTGLSRATAVFAAIFMINSLALAYMGSQQAAEPQSILDRAGQQSAPEDASAAPQIPEPPATNEAPAGIPPSP